MLPLGVRPAGPSTAPRLRTTPARGARARAPPGAGAPSNAGPRSHPQERHLTEKQKTSPPPQKSASRTNPLAESSFAEVDDITPAFWYSPTRFSKKLVLPCKEISSIQSKGLLARKSFGCPKAESNLSATNSMYLVMSSLP